MARILFVDDEPNVLRALQRSLRKEPWEVVTCDDPHEALRRIENEEFAVVVSDYRMPAINGVEVLEYCRFRQPAAMRLILSAYTEKRGMLDAINNAQISRFITKPWDDKDLTSILSNAVETSHLKREKEELLRLVENQRQELIEQYQMLQVFTRQHPELANVVRDTENRIVLDIA